jgi:hypothetical protein
MKIMETTLAPKIAPMEQAKRFYETIRDSIETEENIGKLISIDLETENYEIGTDDNFDAAHRLKARNPNANIFTLRIGYNAVYSLGGVLERTVKVA